MILPKQTMLDVEEVKNNDEEQRSSDSEISSSGDNQSPQDYSNSEQS